MSTTCPIPSPSQPSQYCKPAPFYSEGSEKYFRVNDAYGTPKTFSEQYHSPLRFPPRYEKYNVSRFPQSNVRKVLPMPNPITVYKKK